MSRSTAPLGLGEERAWPNEARIAEQTLALVKRGLIETPQGQLVKRDAHPKAHGCVHGRFAVSPDVPLALRHGLFAAPVSYPVWIRFSNGNPTDDNKGDIRGMGIKVCQVPGEKILTDEKATQDFLLIADRILPVGVPDQYLAFFKTALTMNPLHAIFGIPPWDLVRAGVLLWKTFHFLPTNPLLFPYWSTTPYKLGAGAVK